MSAQKLITDHLDLWTGAVTHKSSRGRGSNGKIELTGIKKLRELILELAVRGKLVDQNPSDEPASVLLERIAEEKARLVKEGKIKKPRKLAPLSGIEKPYQLPSGWRWAQLEELGHDWGQQQPKQLFSYIDVSAIDNVKGKIGKPEIIEPENSPSRARKKVKPGTLIYSTIRPYLQNIAVVDEEIEPEPIASTAFAIISPLRGIPARFLLHYLRSPVFVRYVESVQTGIAYPAINDKQFFSGICPVPPLTEQHRIVEKVDELMALCDRLEQQVGDQLEAHEVLVDTLLDALTRSVDAAEVAENWARIAEHFDTLFTTEASIDKLKQTILQLAVMGRLVEQDPNDEPASVLLERIAEEKARLIKEGKIKKPKPLPEIADNEEPFPIPNEWRWVRFGEITFNRDSERIPLSVNERSRRKGEYDYYGASGIIDKIDDFLFEKPLLLIGEDGANLINRSTPIAFIARGKYWVNNHAHVIDGISEDFLKYLSLYINAISLEPYVTGTAQPKMNQAKMNSIVVGLPPIQEQQRLIEKYDEFMALCDQLKTRLSEAGETRTHLAEAVVEQAV
ncbi:MULTISPECIES: restriction endonuclease subunit S [unclassified Halomonas]|uniref:restriction endonuclease subunit S n=1 Tax=unclassified Halomonas TaxID=2609666 RepID=UPI002888AC73|nr:MULTISPECIES: restriction endonuclease subunit S [unclassified Halomonas]MDT0501767.1 restriction endonuclease subunit S [Halomonas sp. PAR7]MDT0513403.1 restriction endonuclease subunit S [Halomonas sp. LES1]MDT0591830.1 restriction endonuclease subunit S [Halomonas sp. PAR8]